jgi:hypothetical protein
MKDLFWRIFAIIVLVSMLGIYINEKQDRGRWIRLNDCDIFNSKTGKVINARPFKPETRKPLQW